MPPHNSNQPEVRAWVYPLCSVWLQAECLGLGLWSYYGHEWTRSWFASGWSYEYRWECRHDRTQFESQWSGQVCYPWKHQNLTWFHSRIESCLAWQWSSCTRSSFMAQKFPLEHHRSDSQWTILLRTFLLDPQFSTACLHISQEGHRAAILTKWAPVIREGQTTYGRDHWCFSYHRWYVYKLLHCLYQPIQGS